jgi:hypothetical protein
MYAARECRFANAVSRLSRTFCRRQMLRQRAEALWQLLIFEVHIVCNEIEREELAVALGAVARCSDGAKGTGDGKETLEVYFVLLMGSLGPRDCAK